MNKDITVIETGDIVPAYPYLWKWQRDKGEDAGRKERPVCAVIAIKDKGDRTHLLLLAISGTPASSGQIAIEIPPLEVRRIGLDDQKQAWITVSECNYDVLELSFSLEPPRQKLKKLSPGFLKTVLRAFRSTAAATSGRIDRI